MDPIGTLLATGGGDLSFALGGDTASGATGAYDGRVNITSGRGSQGVNGTVLAVAAVALVGLYFLARRAK